MWYQNLDDAVGQLPESWGIRAFDQWLPLDQAELAQTSSSGPLGQILEAAARLSHPSPVIREGEMRHCNHDDVCLPGIPYSIVARKRCL